MQRFHRMLFYLQNTIDSCLGTVLKIARNMASFSSGFFHIHPTWHWGARCPARGERKIMTKSLILERKTFGHYWAATENPIVSQRSRVNWFQCFRIVFLIGLKVFDVRELENSGAESDTRRGYSNQGIIIGCCLWLSCLSQPSTITIVTTPGGEENQSCRFRVTRQGHHIAGFRIRLSI